MMEDCVICRKHKDVHIDEILYADNHWVLLHGPIQSNILGYFYLEPKRHVEYWSELTHEELESIGLLIKDLEQLLKNELNVERLYVVTISELVRHLHFHLIPRLENSEKKGIPLILQATTASSTYDLQEQDIHSLIQKMKRTIKPFK